MVLRLKNFEKFWKSDRKSVGKPLQFFRKINQKSFSQKFNSGLIQRKFNSIQIFVLMFKNRVLLFKIMWQIGQKKRFFDEKKTKKWKKSMKFSMWEILRKKSEKKWKKENRPRKLSKNYAPFNSNLIQESSSKNFSVLPWTLQAHLASVDESPSPLPSLILVSLSYKVSVS